MADRPRIRQRHDRVVVLRRHYDRYTHPWTVWHGWKCVARYATHAEAITAATELAHDTAPRVWTTPDSGTQADYSLATGSA